MPSNLLWTDDALRILDQRCLPHAEHYLVCRTAQDVVEAIRSLAVRGAPAVGLAGAYGVALAAIEAAGSQSRLAKLVETLADARPTAINLRREVLRTAALTVGSAKDMAAAALAAALQAHARDRTLCEAIAVTGADLIAPNSWALTHCHTGALATGGIGTAFGALALAHARGTLVGVYACEARPLWQGARLTAWECERLGIPCKILVDAAAGSVLAAGRCQAVFVGADRIAANGDTANKIGTYPLAVLASRHGIPFYVLAPSSTLDTSLRSGVEIPIEERDPREVTDGVAPAGATAFNPAFDITPGSLISAVVTERGIYRRPYRFTVADDAPE